MPKEMNQSYRLSLTGANAMVPEFSNIGKVVAEGESISGLDTNVLGREKTATNIRELRELKHRIKQLTAAQIEILATGSHDQQKQITHLALAKAYAIYKEFILEVMREKVIVFDYTLTELDYNIFFNRKQTEHPELEKTTASTQRKIKTVMFRMLQQVGFINSVANGTILVPFLDTRMEQVVIDDHSGWLACFLYDDNRIQSLQ